MKLNSWMTTEQHVTSIFNICSLIYAFELVAALMKLWQMTFRLTELAREVLLHNYIMSLCSKISNKMTLEILFLTNSLLNNVMQTSTEML